MKTPGRLYYFISFVVLLSCLWFWACSGQRAQDLFDLRPVRLATTQEPLTALVLIANKQGFFADEGLLLKLKNDFVSDADALEEVFLGNADLAVTSEVPVVLSSFEKEDYCVAATIASSDNELKILTRTDVGGEVPQDLLGKKVGTQRGSAAHFFWHLFSIKHGLEETNVVFDTAEKLLQAFEQGEVAALSTHEPFLSRAQTLAGEKALVFSTPGLYFKTYNLVGGRPYFKEHQQDVEKVISALMRAEEFAASNPEEAIAIVSDKLGLGVEKIKSLWPAFDLKVTLEQSLFQTFGEEARWVQAAKLTGGKDIPNYLRYVCSGSLKAVDREAVMIIEQGSEA